MRAPTPLCPRLRLRYQLTAGRRLRLEKEAKREKGLEVSRLQAYVADMPWYVCLTFCR